MNGLNSIPRSAAVGVLDLPCPACEAVAGEDCWAEQPHLDRVELADAETARIHACTMELAA